MKAANGEAALRARKTRASVQMGAQLFVYDGETLAPVRAPAPLVNGFTWAVAPDDTLFVALPSKTLLVEPPRGPNARRVEMGWGWKDAEPYRVLYRTKRPAATPATTSACSGCHDFDSERAPSALQSNEQEHRASRDKGTRCVDCHMEQAGPRARDHRFDVTRKADVLARALAVEGARRGPDHAAFVLRSVGVGHRFPTGDMFRRSQSSRGYEYDFIL